MIWVYFDVPFSALLIFFAITVWNFNYITYINMAKSSAQWQTYNNSTNNQVKFNILLYDFHPPTNPVC